MAWFVSFLAVIYLFALVILVPQTFMGVWDMIFAPVQSPLAVQNITHLVLAIVISSIIMAWLLRSRRAGLQDKIGAVRPSKFKADVEIYGPHDREYVGICSVTDQIIVVDTKRNVARCEPLSFLQCWTIEDEGTRTALTLQFKSFDFSSLRVVIAPNSRHDIAAKLNFVVNG